MHVTVNGSPEELQEGATLADLIDKLTPAQLMRIAASNTLLCRFRFDDRVILDLLVAKGDKRAISSAHAAILMAQQPAEALA